MTRDGWRGQIAWTGTRNRRQEKNHKEQAQEPAEHNLKMLTAGRGSGKGYSSEFGTIHMWKTDSTNEDGLPGTTCCTKLNESAPNHFTALVSSGGYDLAWSIGKYLKGGILEKMRKRLVCNWMNSADLTSVHQRVLRKRYGKGEEGHEYCRG